MSVAVVMWSSNLITGAILADAVPPALLSAMRQAVCLVVLLPFALPKLREAWPMIRARGMLLAVMGLLALAVPHTAIYMALHTTQSMNVALMNSVVPVLVIMIAWIGGTSSVGMRAVIGIGFSLAGAVLIVIRGDISHLWQAEIQMGDALAVLAALSIATYTVLYTSVEVALPPLVFLAYGAAVSTAALVPLAIVEAAWLAPTPWKVDWSTALTVVYLGIGPSAIAVASWNWGLARVGAARGSQMVHLIPGCTAILGVLVLGERLHAYHGTAFLAIVFGLMLANWRSAIFNRRGDSARTD